MPSVAGCILMEPKTSVVVAVSREVEVCLSQRYDILLIVVVKYSIWSILRGFLFCLLISYNARLSAVLALESDGIASFFQPRYSHCPRGSKDADENGSKEEDEDDSSEDEEDISEDEVDDDDGEGDIVMEEGNQEDEDDEGSSDENDDEGSSDDDDDEGSSDDDDEGGYEDEYDEEAIQEGDNPDPTRLDLRQSERRVFVLLSSSSSL
ncbi:hypothetical protein MLD38_017467 [Melastoma candidum]|uniref:Uncharacterized protein n=1 Tax=Melastoma candidum TaxID=119954 RepID=A0ACB9QQQ0_9MYRT|nr:hypothetical protein MLD38_017467 [Melastoma candidum]